MLKRLTLFILSGFFLLNIFHQTVLAVEIDPGGLEERDSETYTNYPLVFNQSASFGTGSNKDIIIWNLVKDQGYEVHCGDKMWRINKSTWGDVESYFKPINYLGPVELNGIDDEYLVDLTKGKIPLFRGTETLDTTNKVSSFEGFFGARNPGTVADSLNLNGVASNLLNLQQQCQIKYNNLTAVNQICSRLTDPSQCAINNKEISGSEYKVKDLFSILTKYKKQEVGCEHFGDIWNNLEPKIQSKFEDKQSFLDIQDAIQSLPIDMDLSYRLAFLVISPKQDPQSNDPFYFIQSDQTNKNKKEEAPIFIAFKIPNFVANESNSILYQDSSKITGRLLRTEDVSTQIEEDDAEQRDDFLSNILSFRGIYKIVDCRGMPQCSDDDLREALIDMINGSDKTCSESPVIEMAGDLASPADVNSDTREFQLGLSNFAPASSKASQYFNWQLRLEKASDIDAPIGDDGQGIKVQAHLIAPIGANLDYLNQTLIAFWSSEAFQTMLSSENPPDYYPLADAAIRFNSSNPSFTYKDNDDCREETFTSCNENGDCSSHTELVCQNKTFGATLIEENKTIGILGAKLGWLIRKIQETLRPEGSMAWKYIKSCKTTEDLFLGRCGGDETEEETNENVYQCGSTPTSTTSDACQIVLGCTGSAIESLMENKTALITAINEDKPGGFMTEEIFDLVISESAQVGWNPALILALGWEETGWGAVGRTDKVLGCLGGESSTDPKQIVINQIQCVANSPYFSNQSSCDRFMCYYSGDTMNGDACSYVTNPESSPTNPIFYQNLPYFYEWVTTGQKPS